MRHNRKTAIILTLCLLAGTTACGEKKSEPGVSSSDIELIEPVNTASNTEIALCRNLYDYKIVSGFVYPDMHEYAFSLDTKLSEYLVLPGDHVRKGTPLVKGDEKDLQDEIEELEERMDRAREAHLEKQDAFNEELADLNERMGDMRKQHDELQEDAWKLPYDAEWAKSVRDTYNALLWNMDYQMETIQLQIDKNRLQAAQEAQLYGLDAAYNLQKLEDLKKRKDRCTVYSGVDGVVAALRPGLNPGDGIGEGIEVIAVAGSDQKIIRCEYVKQSEVDKCEDLYAVINGVRYEVTYQPYTNGEYNKLLEKNGTVYSSFLVDDPQDQVKIGDYAVLVELISDTGPVLTVPKGALHRDELGYFVYCVSDGESVPVHIRVGKNDGVYTQVLSGLEGGEVILLTDSNLYGANSVTVKRGSVSTEYTRACSSDYPSISFVMNPVKHGTTYLTQMEVHMFSTVKKGDVIATVRVVPDDVALYEKQLELKRMNERLSEVMVERVKKQIKYDSDFGWRDRENEKPDIREQRQAAESEIAELTKDIERRQKEIDKLREEIQEWEDDYAVTTIRANASGIIYWGRDYETNYILPSGGYIATISESDRCLFKVEDDKHQLVFGSTVTVEYYDRDGKKNSTEGTVVTASYPTLSRALVPEEVYVQIPQEVIDGIMQSNEWGEGLWVRGSVIAQTRRMDNVLIIPRGAVHVMNGKTYVYVKNADGSVVARSFIAGGSNYEYYWVVDGLEEGMIICSE